MTTRIKVLNLGKASENASKTLSPTQNIIFSTKKDKKHLLRLKSPVKQETLERKAEKVQKQKVILPQIRPAYAFEPLNAPPRV